MTDLMVKAIAVSNVAEADAVEVEFGKITKEQAREMWKELQDAGPTVSYLHRLWITTRLERVLYKDDGND